MTSQFHTKEPTIQVMVLFANGGVKPQVVRLANTMEAFQIAVDGPWEASSLHMPAVCSCPIMMVYNENAKGAANPWATRLLGKPILGQAVVCLQGPVHNDEEYEEDFLSLGQEDIERVVARL
jgi:hypothetical protein